MLCRNLLQVARYFLSLLFLLGIAGSGNAATFTVTTGADIPDNNIGDGICETGLGCSFRAAIQEANALPGADTVVLTLPTSPHNITQGPIELTDDRTVIVGDGGRPVIDGLNNIFEAATIIVRGDSCKVSGVWLRRSRGDAIRIEGSCNLIGGSTFEQGVVFTSNGLDRNNSAAIKISGDAARENRVNGCLIGVYGNGMFVDGNVTGVMLSHSASNNLIGDTAGGVGNIISANERYGVWITGGAFGTIVCGNIVGVLADGVSPAGNGWGGVLIDGGARKNQIGGSAVTRSIISGNAGNGITISDATTEHNRVFGCIVGLDVTGIVRVGNHDAGVAIFGAEGNIIGGYTVAERNVISSNYGDGVRIAGAEAQYNVVAGNYVGLDIEGRRSRGNGTVDGNGITISDHASLNTVGGDDASSRNVISGQLWFGVLLNSASNNTISANFIGCNPLGTSSIPNGAGIVIRNGSSGNVVGGSTPAERNLISGNYGDIFPYGSGLMLLDHGTANNLIIGNYIGADTSGTRSVPNREAGVMIGAGASYNHIGGDLPGEGNLISGNGFGTLLPDLGRGIHVFGAGTFGNRIEGNVVGLAADGVNPLRNFGHGISIVEGAERTFIGGNTESAGNLIARNLYHGVYIADQLTRTTTIRHNRIGPNDSLGIVIKDSAQEGATPPLLSTASPVSASGLQAPPNGIVDIYVSGASSEKSGASAVRLAGSGTADGSGAFNVEITDVHLGDTLTAIATDTRGNSSALAAPIGVTAATGFDEDVSGVPDRFALTQNFPNPFNPSTVIRYTLPRSSAVTLEIVNTLGQLVRTLVDSEQSAREYSVEWDGRCNDGAQAASGVYFYRLRTDVGMETRKMLLLR